MAKPAIELVGRTAEQARIDQLLDEVRAGHSASLVLHGEKGIGKTALLDYAARRATGCQIITTRGVEAERDLPYAALHVLCSSVGDSLKQLPAAQREALETAIGLRVGPEPDRFLAVLGLRAVLSAAAEARPLVCLIDDAEWLDKPSAHVFASAARRLKRESVALLIAERQPDEAGQFIGLPELGLDGLPDAGMRQLFGALIPGRVDESVLGRIVAETRGNPRALLEYLDCVSPAEFAGGLGLRVAPTARGIDTDLRVRVGRLANDSWQLLLLAAAEPVGDPWMIWRSAANLGIPMEAADPLEAAGLLSLDSRVLFERPLLRAMVYGMASKEERRHAHRALADVTNQVVDPARRVWHLAGAAAGPDDKIAQQLDGCAAAVRERAGLAAAAAFLERAAMLTLDATLRVDRALRAATAKVEANDPSAAARLVMIADLGAVDAVRKHRVLRSRAQITSAERRGTDCAELLATAAQQMEPTEPAVARETYLEALESALRSGRLGSTCAEEIAAAAQALQPPRAVDLLLDALAVRLTKSYEDAVVPMRSALDALRRSPSGEQHLRWVGLGSRLASDLWDDEMWHEMTALGLERARGADALAVLPYALTDRAMVELSCGDLAVAAALVDEADAVTARTGIPPLSYTSLVLAAWRGDHDAFDLYEHAREDAHERAEGVVLTTARYSAAVHFNSLRRYDEALTAATEAADFDEPALGGWALVELIEAATRRDRRDVAARALERLSDRTSRIGSDWALGTEARCRALISNDDEAEDLYREAVERLERTRIRTELARAQLVYGEWLRRQGRRLDARTLLRAARESFGTMGANAFAERAHLELVATGETARSRSVDTQTHLTSQEARVAVLARDGLTNPEIGERLFVSPKTVEYHLHNVYSKLGLTSRKELHLALADAAGDASQTYLPPLRSESSVVRESQYAGGEPSGVTRISRPRQAKVLTAAPDGNPGDRHTGWRSREALAQ